MTTFSLSSFFANGTDEGSLADFRPAQEFDVNAVTARAAETVRNTYRNIFSCFELEGPEALWETISLYIRRKNLLTAAMEAVKRGDPSAYAWELQQALKRAFVELMKRGALDRIKIVDEFPEEAESDMVAIQRSLQVAEVAPEKPVAAVVPVVVDPIEECVSDFHKLGSSQFRTKWMASTKNRSIFERATAEGRL